VKSVWAALALTVALAAGPRALTVAVRSADRTAVRGSFQATLTADLDSIFNDPVLARALIGVRVESLRDGQLLYSRDSAKLVMPASNMKLLTMSVAADKLGWDFRFHTRLELLGTIADGTYELGLKWVDSHR